MSNLLSSLLSSTSLWLCSFSLLVFLVVFWLLRGSPIGQTATFEDDDDAPRSSRRDGVILAVSLGMVLIALGVFIALTSSVGWSMLAFAPGFAIVLTLVSKNERYRHASPSLRRTFEVSTTLLNATLLAGILIVANVMAYRYGSEGFDLTREAAFSLSSLSVNQFRTLEKPVTFTAYFGQGAVSARQSDRVRQLLQLYKAVQPSKVNLVYLNPFRDINAFETLLKRVPELVTSQGGGVVIEYGDEHVVLRNTDLFDIPRALPFNPDVNGFESVFNGEDAITSAVTRLREGRKPKVAFTTGHGEVPLASSDSAKPRLALWKSRLAASWTDVFEWNLLGRDLPDDLALLVIAGPVTAFQPEEIKRIEAYLNKKKPLMILLDEPEPTGLEPILKRFGVEIEKGVVFDPSQNYEGSIDMVYIPIGPPENPIVAPLENRRVLFVKASSLKEAGSDTKAAAPSTLSRAVMPILQSGKDSRLEPDRKRNVTKPSEEARASPSVLGMAVTERGDPSKRERPLPRLVLFSSRLLGDDRLLRIEPTNLDLLMNAVGWLRSREEQLGIAPKTHVSETLTADPVLRARLVMVPTVMSFLVIIICGVAIYLTRRS